MAEEEAPERGPRAGVSSAPAHGTERGLQLPTLPQIVEVEKRTGVNPLLYWPNPSWTAVCVVGQLDGYW